MWRIIDSGRAPGVAHMETDRVALEAAQVEGSTSEPLLHLFQWDQPTVSYGYLLEEQDVRKWAAAISHGQTLEYVKRPTGGGAVKHELHDLSLSLLWRRGAEIFPDNPRSCYADIHATIQKAIQPFFTVPLTLHAKSADACAEQTGIFPSSHFSACFESPVCNDIMLGGRKIVGGALRVTRQAMLYQGNIDLAVTLDLDRLKDRLSEAFIKYHQPLAAV